ncbi:MAG: AAA family ATPase [Clostridia bacterium]|nr:AAA family ATPase [Clostridia bacterium]
MGTYLNPGTVLFEEAVNSRAFVDKSDMILFLNTLVNTGQKYVGVFRPRRFGKTMAANMVCAYYGRGLKRRALFEKRKIASSGPCDAPWDRYLGKFDVLKLVMTDFLGECETVDEMLEAMTWEVTDELREAFPDVEFGDESSVPTAMQQIYRETLTQFVIVIDEWDAVFRQRADDETGQRKYLDFLCNFFWDRPYIALVYMTGILPISTCGGHSCLNMFCEYSMIAPREMAPYVGFTEGEVKNLCVQYGRDFEKMKERYDGYLVQCVVPMPPEGEGKTASERYTVWNPYTVARAITKGLVLNFWNSTETFEALAQHVRRDDDGLRDAVARLMGGGSVTIDTRTCQNAYAAVRGRDEILTLLIHLGYLTFDEEQSAVHIPNREILDVFRTCAKVLGWRDILRSMEGSPMNQAI